MDLGKHRPKGKKNKKKKKNAWGNMDLGKHRPSEQLSGRTWSEGNI